MHNLNTWAGGFYLGAGAGAHGHEPQPVVSSQPSVASNSGKGSPPAEKAFQSNIRYANVDDPGKYLETVERGDLPQAFTETVDPAARAREIIYTGLRMMRGLDLQHLAGVIPSECCERVARAAPALVAEGLVDFDGRVVRLSPRGELFADRVALDLI